jgi:hypothetical protein
METKIKGLDLDSAVEGEAKGEAQAFRCEGKRFYRTPHAVVG